MGDREGEHRGGETSEERGGLRRVISPRVLMLFVLGDILGTGIYVLAGDVAGEVGGAIWVPLMVAVTLAFLTAFSYAELVTKYPEAAGAALYVDKAFGIPLVTFLVAFAVVMSGVTSASAASQAFGTDYLSVFIELPVLLVALLFITVVAVINFRGISESSKANSVFTLIEASGLVIIILIGIITLISGDGDPGRAMEFKEGANIPLAILAGATLAFYALIGFEDSVNVAEETNDPIRVYPRALFGGLTIAAIIYFLVAFTASMVVETAALSGSDAPLLEVVEVSDFPIPLELFSLVALIAITNTALLNMVMASRLTYGMARRGVIPPLLSKVHEGRRTPLIAIVLTTLLAFALIITGDLEVLASTTVALLLAVFAMVNISCLVARKRSPVDHEHFNAPTIFPVLGAIACLVLLTQQEAAVYRRAGLLLLIGLVLWVVNRVTAGRTEASGAEKNST
ncbi:MAG: APC family permease [Actinomycetota bacterium]|nr:APC family permease [Actinomycetota bacterium]